MKEHFLGKPHSTLCIMLGPTMSNLINVNMYVSLSGITVVATSSTPLVETQFVQDITFFLHRIA